MGIWSLRNKYVLIVDDFPGMRTMLRNMITPFRPEHIAEAKTGEEAIEAIEENHFDIILCDYNLGPAKDGQEVLEEIKERNLLPFSSIYIMVTAENTSDMVMGVVEYLPDDYLSKPFTKEVLISRLQKLLKKKSNLKEISYFKQNNDHTSVITHCDKLLDNNPNNRLELLRIKSESFIELSKYDNAEILLSQILREREIPWALLFLGQIQYYKDNFDEAEAIFKDMVRNYPNYLLAHDWLAKTYQKKNNLVKAQEILKQASEKSPKAVRRQQILAKVSYDNSDFDTSEDSFRRITKMGKHSFFTGPDDYFGLANVYLEKGMKTDALDTISDMRKIFSEKNTDKNIKSFVNEVYFYSKLQNIKETNNALDRVITEFTNRQNCITSSDASELAKICYSLERVDDGNRFIEYVIKNNHDNTDIINNIIQELTNAGLSDNQVRQILKSRDQVIEINNQGVKLATTGKIAESLSLLINAANEMPENQAINLNTAQSLIMHMKESGCSSELLKKTKIYLDKAKQTGALNKKYQLLTSSYNELFSKFSTNTKTAQKNGTTD